MFLGLDLRGDDSGDVGYRARDNAPLLDMTRTRAFDPDAYWEGGQAGGRRPGRPHPERFYLLMSDEAVMIPPAWPSEMTAYDPTSGELRTHYAGFFDPGFGYDPDGGFTGSRAALEVRAHDVPFMIETRAAGVQADVRADARGAERALRLRDRLVVPGSGGDPGQALRDQSDDATVRSRPA